VVLELHHIAGRRNSEAMVVLCANCHKRQSDAQEDHDPDLRREDPERGLLSRSASMQQGQAALLLAIAEQLTVEAALSTARDRYIEMRLGPRWWEKLEMGDADETHHL
jgi:hypothetical protein